ncbi:MAG: HlyC/CorC family transporter [Eubacterium sp.]|nr:HlyC/CorC family transporter [Eubacterium sp.]
MTPFLMIAGIVLCICFSAFFSASEMAFSSCNRLRLEKMGEDGNKNASLAHRLVQKYDDLLGTILIGNNLVNVAASSLASVVVILLTGGETYTWVATVIITISVIIFGETIPKILAKKNATKFSVFSAPVLRILMIILTPLVRLVVWLINLITRNMKPDKDEKSEEAVEELQSIIDTAKEESVLNEEETELVKAAIDFSEISARDVMTSRVDMEAIDIEDDREKILKQLSETKFTRLPVYEGRTENIIGILHMNIFLKTMILNPNVEIRKLLRQPCYVYQTTKLPAVLNQMKKTSQHLAVVTGEFGDTVGVISLEDVMEEIVGEIWDESDTVEEEAVKRKDGSFEIDGEMTLEDLRELLNLKKDAIDAESTTVSGWTIERFGEYPKPGDTFEEEGILEVTVLEADSRRVDKVLIRKKSTDEENVKKNKKRDKKPSGSPGQI